MKRFFDFFGTSHVTVRIERHPKTEFLLNSIAPARIVARRMTAAVDKRAKLSDILDPAMVPVEREPARPARIIHRRFTDETQNSEAISGIQPNGAEQHGTKTYVPRKIIIANEENFQASIKSNVPAMSSGKSHVMVSNELPAVQSELVGSTEKRMPLAKRAVPALLPIDRNCTNNAAQFADRDGVPNLADNPLRYLAYIQAKYAELNLDLENVKPSK